MHPEETLAPPEGTRWRYWLQVLVRSWKKTDLVHVMSRKILLHYGLLWGLCVLVLLVREVSSAREAISTRHDELQLAAEKTLSEALWTYNGSLLNSIVFGLVQDAAVTGARVRTVDGREVFESGFLTGSSAGWGTWLSNRYVSMHVITWTSGRGVELIGQLELETSEDVIRQQVVQRMLTILLFSTLALFSFFVVFLFVIRRHVVQPLSALTHLMNAYRLGETNRSPQAVERAPEEIGELYESFEDMEQRLSTAHGQLRAAAAEMRRQLDEQAAQLSEAHASRMALEISRAQEGERRRLMRDMHDGFGSELASARIALERGTLGQREIATILSKCIADLHLIINVTGHDEELLAEAIADWRYRVSRQLGGEPLRLVWEINLADAPAITPRAVLQVLRIAQEALFNAVRHSGASEINIKVHYDDGAVVLIVSDNGKGIPPECTIPNTGRGKGLASMMARARELGATLVISGDRGCTVKLVYRPQLPALVETREGTSVLGTPIALK